MKDIIYSKKFDFKQGGNTLNINWMDVQDEVTSILRDLVRFDTTNPPGNELQIAHYIANLLKKEGFNPIVIESEPGRGNVICRWNGSGDREESLLLLSHLDVVGVEKDKWLHDPFGGELIGRYIWGRGTLDTKNLTAAELVVMMLLKRMGLCPKRDIIFAATADEEAGGNKGLKWILENRPDLMNPTYVINEGGGHDILLDGKRFYTCQTGEKGYCRFRIKAHGEAGHASTPRGPSPVQILAKALVVLSEVSGKTHLTATTKEFFRRIAENVLPPLSDAFLRLTTADTIKQQMIPGSLDFQTEVYAMTHTTAVPTMLRAGETINVIPSEATAWIDSRLVPGESPNDLLATVEGLLSRAELNVELEVLNSGPGIEFSINTDLFRTICEVMSENDPGSTVVPYLSPGATDAKHLFNCNNIKAVYGFKPMKQDPDVPRSLLVHAHNERISVDNLLLLTKVLFDITKRFCV